MIQVLVDKDKEGRYRGFTSKGHAGYSVKGKDIVCAAVSILIINTINALEAFSGDEITVTKGNGKLTLKFAGLPNERSVLLMDTMLLGLKGIQREYGKKYLILEEKEV